MPLLSVSLRQPPGRAVGSPGRWRHCTIRILLSSTLPRKIVLCPCSPHRHTFCVSEYVPGSCRWMPIVGIKKKRFRRRPRVFPGASPRPRTSCRPMIQYSGFLAKSCHSGAIPQHLTHLLLAMPNCRRSERLFGRGLELCRRIIGVEPNCGVKIGDAPLIISAANPHRTTYLKIEGDCGLSLTAASRSAMALSYSPLFS